MNNELWLERAAYIESMEKEVDALRQQLANMVERYNVRKELADHLGQELAEKDAQIERLKVERDEARRTVRMAHEEGTKQLAASQLREQQLVGAIDGHINPCGCFAGCAFCNNAEKLSLEAALALPSDNTALDALIAKAGEVMRRSAITAIQGYAHWADTTKQIRALPGVKLEDLK